MTRHGSDATAKSVTSYCYDPNGKKTATVTPDGNTSRVAACADNIALPDQLVLPDRLQLRLTRRARLEDDPDDQLRHQPRPTSYTYDPAGNLLTSEDPNGVTTTNTYTPLNQLATVTTPTRTPNASYGYDANGNRTTMSDATGTSSYELRPVQRAHRRPKRGRQNRRLHLRR